MKIRKVGVLYEINDNDMIVVRKFKPSPRWDKIWVDTAKQKSTLTRCFTRGAGAEIVADYRFEVSGGFNGPPIGARHPQERHPEGKDECLRRYYGYGSGDGTWICPCGHAERNAIALAARLGRATQDKTIYLYTDPPVLPCLNCAVDIIQSGINELVVNSFNQYETRPHACNVLELLKEGGVLVRYPLKEEK